MEKKPPDSNDRVNKSRRPISKTGARHVPRYKPPSYGMTQHPSLLKRRLMEAQQHYVPSYCHSTPCSSNHYRSYSLPRPTLPPYGYLNSSISSKLYTGRSIDPILCRQKSPFYESYLRARIKDFQSSLCRSVHPRVLNHYELTQTENTTDTDGGEQPSHKSLRQRLAYAKQYSPFMGSRDNWSPVDTIDLKSSHRYQYNNLCANQKNIQLEARPREPYKKAGESSVGQDNETNEMSSGTDCESIDCSDELITDDYTTYDGMKIMADKPLHEKIRLDTEHNDFNNNNKQFNDNIKHTQHNTNAENTPIGPISSYKQESLVNDKQNEPPNDTGVRQVQNENIPIEEEEMQNLNETESENKDHGLKTENVEQPGNEKLNIENEQVDELKAENVKQRENKELKTENVEQPENEELKSENVEQLENEELKTENIEQPENEELKTENIEQLENEELKTENIEQLENEELKIENVEQLENEVLKTENVKQPENEVLITKNEGQSENEELKSENVEQLENEELKTENIEQHENEELKTENIEQHENEELKTENIEQLENEELKTENIEQLENEELKTENVEQLENEELKTKIVEQLENEVLKTEKSYKPEVSTPTGEDSIVIELTSDIEKKLEIFLKDLSSSIDPDRETTRILSKYVFNTSRGNVVYHMSYPDIDQKLTMATFVKEIHETRCQSLPSIELSNMPDHSASLEHTIKTTLAFPANNSTHYADVFKMSNSFSSDAISLYLQAMNISTCNLAVERPLIVASPVGSNLLGDIESEIIRNNVEVSTEMFAQDLDQVSSADIHNIF
ncbi:hypothetical protein M8J75_001335 [Diaphorina citri]|nr:hypothetical protein M8J75_001335 [Diaphorina citri]